VFHYSAVISDEVLSEAGVPLDLRFDIHVRQPSPGWLQHADQITWGAVEARRMFERPWSFVRMLMLGTSSMRARPRSPLRSASS